MSLIQETLYPLFLRYPIIVTDSRQPQPGSIFFALSGPAFDGNAFAKAALDSGSVAAVVDKAEFALDERYILVEDVLKALQDLAQFHRRQLKCTVIGITGSNGKTTSKELIRSVLARKYKVKATFGNLNNQIGVPLTLLGLTNDIQIAIIEMGASKPGDIKELVDIAEPDAGLITNIGRAHLEGMGGYEGVVKTKTELYDFLRAHDGTAFVNTDHAVFVEQSKEMKVFRFGSDEGNEIIGVLIDSDPYVRFRWKKQGAEFGSIIETRLMGRYNYENILAAVAIGVYFGVDRADINKAVSEYEPDNNRSQLIETGKNTLILDAYNANPTSMEAALTNFAGMKGGPKIVVLGRMNELGKETENEHQRIAKLATESGFEKVFLIGDAWPEVDGVSKMFSTAEEAMEWLDKNRLSGYKILVKGSRTNRLERLRDFF